MIQQYSHHIGGGGFSTNCSLSLDKENCTFEINFNHLSMSSKNKLLMTGTISYEKNNYHVLNTTYMFLNEKEYKSKGVTFEFIKFDDVHEMTEHNNEWKDVSMGNQVNFNSNYDFNAMLVVQREIFDYAMVSCTHSELEKLLYWFSNMKFLQINTTDDVDDESI